MQRVDISAEQLIRALLWLSEREHVSILDSCGVGYLGSHLLIAGIDPVDKVEICDEDAAKTLALVDEKLSANTASIFTISYDFGLKLLGLDSRFREVSRSPEPDIFIASFAAIIIHDYDSGVTRLVGEPGAITSVQQKIDATTAKSRSTTAGKTPVTSNFTKHQYLAAIASIKESIRRGDTYQTNLTQQLTATLADGLTPQQIFSRLRSDHPAPFAAFITRDHSTVVSASPERFIKISNGRRSITTSPIKGTRPRGETIEEDESLRNELLTSGKDRAENTMIVDLLRNDLGRVCEYGSITVDKLCELEEHPTFFHLVSTVSGDLRPDAKLSDILRAVFPCGSITGAPKISTMGIIDDIEPDRRGLSMGAIGYYIPGKNFDIPETLEMSVAIRTMVIHDRTAKFNVGGGIVIDSDPEKEYEETMTKAKGLLNAINGELEIDGEQS